MTIGLQATFTKQSHEVKAYVFDLTGIFSNRPDLPTGVTLTTDLGLTGSAVLSGQQITVTVSGGVDTGIYGGTLLVSTNASLVEEIDFRVKVQDTPSSYNGAAEAVGAQNFAEQAQTYALQAQAAAATYVSPIKSGAVGDGVANDTATLHQFIDTFKRSAVSAVTAMLADAVPVEIDLAGRVYKISSTLDFTNVYRVKLKNGRINADPGVTWTGPMLNIAMESGVPYPTDNWRQQRIRDLTFDNVVFDGKLTANVMLLQSTYGITIVNCTFLGNPSTGYLLRAVPNPKAGAPSPSVGQTKNTHLVVRNCNFSQYELSDDAHDGAGTGMDIGTADFEISGCKAWKLDTCLSLDYCINGQILGNHFFTKAAKFCAKVGAEAAGMIFRGNYWDTGIVEFRSFKHSISDDFLAGAQMNLVVTQAGEDMAGFNCASRMPHPVVSFEGAGSMSATPLCNFLGSRKSDGGALVAPSTARLSRGSVTAPSLCLGDFSGFDVQSGLWSPGANQVALSAAGSLVWTTTAAGQMVFGHTAGLSMLGAVTPAVQLHGDSSRECAYSAVRWDSDAVNGGQIVLGRSLSTAIGAYSALTNGKSLGRLAWVGDNGINLSCIGAGISATATGTWTSTSAPAKVTVSTTPAGSVAPVARWSWLDSGHYAPEVDNAYAVGQPSQRPSVVYAGTASINTSDARLKTAVAAMTAAEMSAARDLARAIGTYKFLDAVASKGAAARTHIGMTVQRAIEIMQSHGLDPMAYGFICHDTWEALPEVLGEHGEVLQAAREAGDLYSFRGEELLFFIAAGFEARLSALEAAA